jgi:hypothetical protein
MKKFTDYLMESKRSYTFRVQLANCNLDAEVLERIERALSAYRLSDITKPKSMPVCNCREFATLGPVERHQFDATTDYPAIPPQVQQSIHAHTGIPLQQIYVTNSFFEGDDEWEVETSDKEDSPILLQPEMKSQTAQDSVGDKHVGSLLAELEKQKHGGTQYTGVNDQILAKEVPAEASAKTSLDFPMNNKSVLKSNTAPRGK